MREVRPPSVPATRSPAQAPAPVAQAMTPVVSAPSTVSDGLVPRLREREAVRRRKVRRTVMRVAALIAVVVLAGWLVARSGFFAIDPDAITVDGAQRWVSDAEVVAATGEFHGQSWLTLQTDQVVERVAALPAVREVVVEKVWPDGLVVRITERTPVAVVADPSGAVVVVDDLGVVMPLDPAAVPDLPVMSVPVGPEALRVQQAALAVLYHLPSAVAQRVVSISAQTEDSVSMELDSGHRVEWGSAEDIALKVEVLMVMLDSEAIDGVSVIDVSAPTLPVTRTDE